jgi:hypothetical protein
MRGVVITDRASDELADFCWNKRLGFDFQTSYILVA